MLDLRAFPFTDIAKDKIRTKANHLYRLSGLEITGGPSVDPQGVMFLDVRITQQPLTDGKVLSEDELISKGAALFDGCLPDGCCVRVSVLPYLQQ